VRQAAAELGLEEREVRDWVKQAAQKDVAQQHGQVDQVDLTETTPSKPAAPVNATSQPMDQDQQVCTGAEAQVATADELLQQGSSGVPASATDGKAHTPAVAACSFGASKGGTSSTSHQQHGHQQPGSTAGLAPAGSGVDLNPAVTSSSPPAALQNRPKLLADMQGQVEEATEALKEEHLLPSSISAALDAQRTVSKATSCDVDDEQMGEAQPSGSHGDAAASQLVANQVRSEEVGSCNS
jgi:hypothetical protein